MSRFVDATKAVLTGNFIALNTHTRQEGSRINDFKKLEKHEQMKLKVSRRK